jgi:LacI family transcriptional regulator
VSRAALADQVISMAIATPLRVLAERLVELMVSSTAKKESDLPAQLFLPFDLHISENI